MIIPSLDIQNGEAVQLKGGKDLAILGGDPTLWAEQFSLASEIAVIDLDAARGRGTNRGAVMDLVRRYRCRVGGGIRSVAAARELLDAGACSVIIGTQATPEFLRELPPERVIVALDARFGRVVTEGWEKTTPYSVEERIDELRPYVGGFLVTFVEIEGSLSGINVSRCKALKERAGSMPLTVAGGIRSPEEIAELDALGIDAQVGMALYTGQCSYADAVVAPFISSVPEPWPTVVCNERGQALGLAWSTRESVAKAFEMKRGVYYSRSRKTFWTKGESSGATQELLRVDLDCDRDCIRFTVRQNAPGFCHKGTDSCWGPLEGLSALEQRLTERTVCAPPDSYAQRLFSHPKLLREKLVEEALELGAARTREELIHEGADLLFFTVANLAQHSIRLEEIEGELTRRSRRVTRRAIVENDMSDERVCGDIICNR